MIVYVESSAILGWLFGESSAPPVLAALLDAQRVLTSALTSTECARSVVRAAQSGTVTRAEELAALRLLDQAEAGWDVHPITDRVHARARGRFPVEPVRTLDAIHLATAQLLREGVGQLTMVSLDHRVRANAERLGFDLLPTDIGR